MQQHQNKLHWDRHKDALEAGEDKATNRGFRMNGGMMCTYQQKRLGLSSYYDKHWVLENSSHMVLIEYHMEVEEEEWEMELWELL